MPIALFRVADFRNLATVELAPCARGLNIISGDNGSGKTSLLEAIHYLGLGRSFRSSVSHRLIRHSTNQFSLLAQLINENEQLISIGMERNLQGSSRLRMAEKDIPSIMEFAAYLPIRLINSQSHHLFESGPAFRRKYLDWGLFYQYPQFITHWRHFERALKQRNAALRDKRPKKELDVWTEELVKHGLELDYLRRDYVTLLKPLILSTMQALLLIPSLQIIYQPGWEENEDYLSALNHSYMDDLRLGHTQFGPHRADIDVQIEGIPVKHFLSRGQQKLLICAMILAQGILLAGSANKGIIYLIDDLPSELDLPSRQKLLALLARQKAQMFITAIESQSIYSLINEQSQVPIKLFHVEHGMISTMDEMASGKSRSTNGYEYS